MKKILIITALIATTGAHAAQKCEYGTDEAARMRCRWERGTAPEYFAGCYDATAPEIGEAEAAEVCAAEYAQHKENKARLKAERAAKKTQENKGAAQ